MRDATVLTGSRLDPLALQHPMHDGLRDVQVLRQRPDGPPILSLGRAACRRGNFRALRGTVAPGASRLRAVVQRGEAAFSEARQPAHHTDRTVH